MPKFVMEMMDGERMAAMQALGIINAVCNAATQVTPDQVELCRLFQTQLEKAEPFGPALDTVELNRRIIETFGNFRRELEILLPALRVAASRGPIGDDIKTAEDVSTTPG